MLPSPGDDWREEYYFFLVFFAAGFAATFFLAGAFLAGAFLAGAFFAGAFLAGAFFTAAFFAGAFLADFLAGAFFTGMEYTPFQSAVAVGIKVLGINHFALHLVNSNIHVNDIFAVADIVVLFRVRVLVWSHAEAIPRHHRDNVG